MAEIAAVNAAVKPVETLLVVDAMTGQEAVAVAQAFVAAVPVTGLILTKIDGDARGGAALSISAVTGVPVKFLGTGEKTDALEVFHPDRLAGRILGMGDVLTLVERAQETFDAKQAAKLEEKLRKNSFTLEDILDQLQQVQKMGPLGQVMSMIPGMGGMAKEAQAAVDRGDLKRTEAIIRSMTPVERRDPTVLNALPPPAHRDRLGHHPSRRQPSREAVQRDAEAHEAILRGWRPARRSRAPCPAVDDPIQPGGPTDDRSAQRSLGPDDRHPDARVRRTRRPSRRRRRPSSPRRSPPRGPPR